MGEYEGRREERKVERRFDMTVRGRKQEKALTTKLQDLVYLWREYRIVNKKDFSTGEKLLVDSENHTVLKNIEYIPSYKYLSMQFGTS